MSRSVRTCMRERESVQKMRDRHKHDWETRRDTLCVWCTLGNMHVWMCACLLAVHLQMQLLHVSLFSTFSHVCVCRLLYMQLCVCACMCHRKWASVFKDHLMGFIRNARHTNSNNTDSLNLSCKHKSGNYTVFKPQSSQPFAGEGTLGTTRSSSIQKAFNSTHCASNLCCSANRIFKNPYIPHAFKQ